MMYARAGILILLAVVCLTTSWMFGYREGQQEGAFRLLRQGAEFTLSAKDIKAIKDSEEMDRDEIRDQVHDQLCDKIRHYKESMARDLDEHTSICNWDDMTSTDDPN
jgi:hypothetical protein